MEQYAENVAKWLQNRVEKAEAKDPKLRPMKDRINDISDKINTAKEKEIPKLLKLQDEAIKELMDHVSTIKEAISY